MLKHGLCQGKAAPGIILGAAIAIITFFSSASFAAVGQSANGVLQNAWSYSFLQSYLVYHELGPSAAIADMDPSVPGLEIVTGNREYYPFGYVITSGTYISGRWIMFKANGNMMWWTNTGNDEARSSVLIGDILQNGTLKMVGGTTSGNQIQVLNADGKFLWRFVDSSIASFAFFSTPAMADIYPGGALEVVADSRSSYIHCIDGISGVAKWSFNASSMVLASPAIADLDGNGSLEIVAGATSGNIFCIDSQGTLKWKYSTGAAIESSAALADLDGDGKKEVVVGGNKGQVYVLSSSGTAKWSYATGAPVYSSPAIGDVDGDGAPEVVFGCNAYAYCLGSDGAVKWKTQIGVADGTGGYASSSPALAKRGNTQGLDIYIGGNDNYLYLLRGTNGAVLDKFQLSAKVSACPAVADIDGDGKLEIVISDRYSEINPVSQSGDRMWVIRDANSSVAQYTIEWPMFRADAAHTGVYPKPGSVVVGAPPPPPPPPSSNPPSVPTVTVTSTHTTNPLIKVSGTADAGNTVFIYIRNNASQLTYENWVTASNDGTWSLSDAKLSMDANYITAKAKNAQGLESALSSPLLVQLGALPLPPTNLAAIPYDDRIALGWTRSASANVNAYKMYMSTSGVFNFSAPTAVISSSSTGCSVPASQDILYRFIVHAVNAFGEEQNGNLATAQLGVAPVSSCPSARIKSPHDGKKVSGESLTVVAEIICQDSSGINYVIFEYQPSTGAAWTPIQASNINHPNPDVTFPYFVHWNVAALTQGQYRIRAVAYGQGTHDQTPAYVTVNVDHADPDIVEKTLDQTHLMVTKVEKDKNNVATAGFNQQMAEVTIPSGTITSASTKLVLTYNPQNAPASPEASAESVLSIELESGEHLFSKDVTLVLPYKDANNDGIVDGTSVKENEIAGYTFNDSQSKWEKTGFTVDTAKNQVTIKTNHFSYYGVFSGGAAAASVAQDAEFVAGEAYIFPNPARGGQQSVLHVEAGVADSVEASIYDVSGAMIENLRVTGAPQNIYGKFAYEIPWRAPVSGIYIAVVHAKRQGKPDIRFIRKFGVVR